MPHRTSRGQSAAPLAAPSATDLQRRRFLFSLGAGSAGAAAVAAVPAMAIVDSTPERSENAADGYRETKHVRDYYRTARI
jgi:hypothetical protein